MGESERRLKKLAGKPMAFPSATGIELILLPPLHSPPLAIRAGRHKGGGGGTECALLSPLYIRRITRMIRLLIDEILILYPLPPPPGAVNTAR